MAFHDRVGHHLQRAITAELEGVPDIRRSFLSSTEGSCKFAYEMGFYEDPYSRCGQLAMELLRACEWIPIKRFAKRPSPISLRIAECRICIKAIELVYRNAGSGDGLHDWEVAYC